MATLPRSAKYPPTPTSHPQRGTDFDVGINSSAAWTEHLEGGSTSTTSGSRFDRKFLSESDASNALYATDDLPEQEEETEEIAIPARALYKFEGKAEFHELSVEAGDELEVVKEDVGDGWSLVRDSTGEVGLLPLTYYTLTTEFTLAPDVQLDVTMKREASSSSITPTGTPRTSKFIRDTITDINPIIPQTTGEWLFPFPSFRHSLLGGKSLNRFSSFVTSGAEAYVLKGASDPPVTTDTSISASSKRPGHTKESTTASVLDAREDELTRLGLGEADKHYIDTSPHGPVWKQKTPSFRVLVHSPIKKYEGIGGTNAYTLYSVTSLFPLIPETQPSPHQDDDTSGGATADWVDIDPRGDGDLDKATTPLSPLAASEVFDHETATRVTVYRRFSHFAMLHTALHRRLPGIALPPLPEKQYAGRFSDDFVEARRGDLERYLNKIVRHPVVRYAEVLVFFLGCENDTEFTKRLPNFVTAPSAGPRFYSRIFHPAFNVDAEDAEDTLASFHNHAKAVGKGVQSLRSIFTRAREARVEMSRAERLLSYSLLSLITSKPLTSAPATGTRQEDEQYNAKAKGLVNTYGAWCWREGCSDCLRLTKGVQKMSETLQTVANLYDGHARRTQLATHEALKLMAHPSSHYEGVVTTHKSTLTRYRQSTALGNKTPSYADEEMASRCETVLNTTMAELDTYHTQKVQDLQTILADHLDGEIILYEQVLNRLRAARYAISKDGLEEFSLAPRQASIYERDLGGGSAGPSNSPGGGNGGSGFGVQAVMASRPLPMPCPHVFDAAPMRPVSAAIQEGVGILWGQGRGGAPIDDASRGDGDLPGRGSVFSKFW